MQRLGKKKNNILTKLQLRNNNLSTEVSQKKLQLELTSRDVKKISLEISKYQRFIKLQKLHKKQQKRKNQEAELEEERILQLQQRQQQEKMNREYLGMGS